MVQTHDEHLQLNSVSKMPPLEHEAFVVLGLSMAERKVLIAIWKIAKPLNIIARVTDISPNTLLYILRKLEKRLLVRKISSVGPGLRHKAVKRSWKCEIRRATIRIQSIVK